VLLFDSNPHEPDPLPSLLPSAPDSFPRALRVAVLFPVAARRRRSATRICWSHRWSAVVALNCDPLSISPKGRQKKG